MNHLPGNIWPCQGLAFSFVWCPIMQYGSCEPSLLVLYWYVNKSICNALSYNSCKLGSALVSWLLIRLSVFNWVHFKLSVGFIFQLVHRGMFMMESASDFVVNSAEIDKLIYFKILVTMLISSGLKLAHIKPLNFSVVYMKCHSIKLRCERCAKNSWWSLESESKTAF